MFTTVIIGNLGADAELHTENGNEFVSFKVAHTDRYTDSNGEHEETVWVSCVMNGRLDKLRQYLTKGTRVCCIGDTRLRTYHSKKMQRLVAGANLFVRQIELVGARPDGVPAALFNEDGVQVRITKFYYADGLTSTTLFDRDGVGYTVDAKGWVIPPVKTPTDTEDTLEQGAVSVTQEPAEEAEKVETARETSSTKKQKNK